MDDHHNNIYGSLLLLFFLFIAVLAVEEPGFTGKAVTDTFLIRGETLISSCNEPIVLGRNFALEVLFPYYGCESHFLCEQALEFGSLPGDVTISFNCNIKQKTSFISSCVDTLRSKC